MYTVWCSFTGFFKGSVIGSVSGLERTIGFQVLGLLDVSCVL